MKVSELIKILQDKEMLHGFDPEIDIVLERPGQFISTAQHEDALKEVRFATVYHGNDPVPTAVRIKLLGESFKT